MLENGYSYSFTSDQNTSVFCVGIPIAGFVVSFYLLPYVPYAIRHNLSLEDWSETEYC